MNYWLIKSEPNTYSWDDFVKLGRDHWDGVRNYQARNNMKEMKVGDQALFYHSVKEKKCDWNCRSGQRILPGPNH